MDLKEYFITLSRSIAVATGLPSPSVKALVSGKKKTPVGVMAFYNFDDFSLNVSYIEKGRNAYVQQTIWVSFVLESDKTLPYSLYDILAFTHPDDFNCYTYSYVDSKELMSDCFAQLTLLFAKVIPDFTTFLKSGVNRNKLITSQRESINGYFGDNILESGEMIGGAADKIINMMLDNFFQAEIEAAVVGSQSLFYEGKEQKALKKLKKAKHRTPYQENLMHYIEEGGKADTENATVKSASAEKGALRHGGGVKGAVAILLRALLFSIPVSIGLALVYFIFCKVFFNGNVFTMGFFENLIFIPFFGSLLSVSFAIKFRDKLSKKCKDDSKKVHTPESPVAKNLLKYIIITAECFALIGCLTSVYSNTPFYNDHFTYSQEDFPLSQSEISYDAIDYFALIEGRMNGKNFIEDKYIIAKTKSGFTIDLYNSTFYTTESFLKHKAFFKEKGIEIKTFTTIEEYEKATISN